MLHSMVSYFYYTFFHRAVKWLIRIITGQCELLRITRSNSSLAAKTFSIESSLKRSKSKQLRKVLTDDVNVDEIVNSIVLVKHIDIHYFKEFPTSMKLSINQIVGYRQLTFAVETLRKVSYSSDNAEHEAMLSQLWNGLQPDIPLPSRIGHHWSDIGFQGEDPATDFRGMGLLGLHNLIYLCERYPSISRKLLSRSHHPQFGYSFAIVGINLTSVGCQLLREGHLRSHFYNAVEGSPQISDFNEVYAYIFYNFDLFWFDERPADIMQFNIVKDKFQKHLTDQLRVSTTRLQLNTNI